MLSTQAPPSELMFILRLFQAITHQQKTQQPANVFGILQLRLPTLGNYVLEAREDFGRLFGMEKPKRRDESRCGLRNYAP